MTIPDKYRLQWYCSYEQVEKLVKSCLHKDATILLVGRTWAQFSEALYSSGRRDIVCMDASAEKVRYEREANAKLRAGIKYVSSPPWKGLDFEHYGFDLVVDLGLVDELMADPDRGVEAAEQLMQHMFKDLHKRGSYMLMVSAVPPSLRQGLIGRAPWSAVQTKVLLKMLPLIREVPTTQRQGTITGLEVQEDVAELVDYAAMQQGLTSPEKIPAAYVYVLRKDQYGDGQMSIRA